MRNINTTCCRIASCRCHSQRHPVMIPRRVQGMGDGQRPRIDRLMPGPSYHEPTPSSAQMALHRARPTALVRVARVVRFGAWARLGHPRGASDALHGKRCRRCMPRSSCNGHLQNAITPQMQIVRGTKPRELPRAMQEHGSWKPKRRRVFESELHCAEDHLPEDPLGLVAPASDQP